MRVFVAGATGVIGIRLLPLLVAAGHVPAGMTRSPGKADAVRELGALPVICDVYDTERLTDAIDAFAPDAVVHQLTDLPDQAERIPEFTAANARIRTEGTRKLIAAARAADGHRLLAQSIAWTPPGAAEVIAEHERQVLGAAGVVIRYGQLYGPGTYYEHAPPGPPRTHVEDAARRTVPLLDGPGARVVSLYEDGLAP